MIDMTNWEWFVEVRSDLFHGWETRPCIVLSVPFGEFGRVAINHMMTAQEIASLNDLSLCWRVVEHMAKTMEDHLMESEK